LLARTIEKRCKMLMSIYGRSPCGGKNALCPKCGSQNEDPNRFCPKCGQPLVPNASAYPGNTGSNYGYALPPYPGYVPNMKSGAVAVILAFIIPGVGHLYAGKIMRGIIILAVLNGLDILFTIVLYTSIMGADTLPLPSSTWLLIIVGFVAYFVAWVWQMYDAYKAVEEYNRNLAPTSRCY